MRACQCSSPARSIAARISSRVKAMCSASSSTCDRRAWRQRYRPIRVLIGLQSLSTAGAAVGLPSASEEVADAVQLFGQEVLVLAVERRRSVDQQTLGGCDAPQVGVAAAQLGGEAGQVGSYRHDDANAEDGPGTTSSNGFFGLPSDIVDPARQLTLMSAIE